MGFEIFADNVWHVDYNMSDSSVNMRYRQFRNKSVLLNASIDFSGDSIYGVGWTWHEGSNSTMPYFVGTFDGNNNTLSNFKLSGSECGEILVSGVKYQFVGVFSAIASATIKNLQLLNFSCEAYCPETTSRAYVGGLVANASKIAGDSFDNTIIDNCSIINFSGKLGNDNAQEEFVAPLLCLGTSGVKISNCYIENVCEYGDVDNFLCFGPHSTVDEYKKYGYTWLYDTGVNGVNISDCVINNYLDDYFYDISEVASNAENVYVNFNPGDSGLPSHGLLTYTDSEQSFVQINLNFDTFLALSVDSAGGSSGTTWYYCEEYNDGYPMLRSFITWSKIKIIAGNPGDTSDLQVNGYSVGNSVSRETTIYFPNELEECVFGELDSDNMAYCYETAFDIYGDIVSIVPKSCFVLDYWVFAADYNTYIGYLKSKAIEIEFNGNSLTSQKSNSQVFTIYCGGTIDIEQKLNYVTFTFTDTSSVEHTMTYEVTDARYMISKTSLEDFDSYYHTTYANIHSHEGEVISISVELELKNYNIDFG